MDPDHLVKDVCFLEHQRQDIFSCMVGDTNGYGHIFNHNNKLNDVFQVFNFKVEGGFIAIHSHKSFIICASTKGVIKVLLLSELTSEDRPHLVAWGILPKKQRNPRQIGWINKNCVIMTHNQFWSIVNNFELFKAIKPGQKPKRLKLKKYYVPKEGIILKETKFNRGFREFQILDHSNAQTTMICSCMGIIEEHDLLKKKFIHQFNRKAIRIDKKKGYFVLRPRAWGLHRSKKIIMVANNQNQLMLYSYPEGKEIQTVSRKRNGAKDQIAPGSGSWLPNSTEKDHFYMAFSCRIERYHTEYNRLKKNKIMEERNYCFQNYLPFQIHWLKMDQTNIEHNHRNYEPTCGYKDYNFRPRFGRWIDIYPCKKIVKIMKKYQTIRQKEIDYKNGEYLLVDERNIEYHPKLYKKCIDQYNALKKKKMTDDW